MLSSVDMYVDRPIGIWLHSLRLSNG